jgi:hypothetical protein
MLAEKNISFTEDETSITIGDTVFRFDPEGNWLKGYEKA